MKIDEIISEIESMPVDIKTQIIDRLLNSINSPSKEIDKEWVKIAEKRVSEIHSGKVKTIPGDQVFKEMLAKYSK